ncbi:MAG: DoxX family protein [Planctomycetota bacterium]|nr:DoxX family protein [Planctomycetota bacterium]
MTSVQTPKSDASRRSPLVTTALWICQLGAAGILFFAGQGKLAGDAHAISMFSDLGMEPAGRIAIGALECGAAILLLIRQSAVYGALLGLGVMCGAIIGHLTVLGLGGLPFALLVAALCVGVLYIRRRDAPFLRNLIDR